MARAKLTLSLRVTGVRADGYHLLDAEMVTLDLADRLEILPGDGLEVRGPTAGPVPDGDDNLVRRALAVAGRRAYVRLHKRIPAGAGLGGGSADAAAVLRWAGVSDPEVAARLGADVPFCLVGGRARVTGVGEKVSRCRSTKPPGGLHPADPALAGVDGRGLPGLGPAWAARSGSGANDLEPAALVVEPRLAEWRDRLGGDRGGAEAGGERWDLVRAGSYPGDGRLVVRRRGRRSAARPALPARRFQHLLVLLLAHALAALLDQGSHGGWRT